MKVLRKQDFQLGNHKEHPTKVVFERKEDLERFKVRPEYAKSVKQIYERFVLGVTDYSKFNGNPDLPVDTSNLSSEVSDSLLNNPFDPGDANNIDIVDDAKMCEAAREFVNSHNRKNVKGVSVDSSTVEVNSVE